MRHCFQYYAYFHFNLLHLFGGRIISVRLLQSPASSDCAFNLVGCSVSSRYTFPHGLGSAFSARSIYHITILFTNITRYSASKRRNCFFQNNISGSKQVREKGSVVLLLFSLTCFIILPTQSDLETKQIVF